MPIKDNAEEETYTAEELAALFKEIREDEAAGKREGAHPTWQDIYRIMDEEAKVTAVEKGKDIPDI